MASTIPDFALLSWDRRVLLADEPFLKAWGFRHCDCGPDGFSMKEPIGLPRPVLQWVLRWDGTLIKVQELKREPRTPRFIKPIVNFTRIFYCTKESHPISLSDLAQLCARSSAGLKKPLARALEKHGAEKKIDRQILWDELIGQIVTYEEA